MNCWFFKDVSHNNHVQNYQKNNYYQLTSSYTVGYSSATSINRLLLNYIKIIHGSHQDMLMIQTLIIKKSQTNTKKNNGET